MKKLFKRIFNPDGKNMIPKDQNAIEYLLLQGALQVAGINSKTGEFLYAFTPKIKEIMPQLYHEHINDINAEVMKLWEKGFVNIDLMSENPIITLTKKSLSLEEVANLDDRSQWSLEEIKRLLKKREV
jgi:hypothetical protein